MSVFIVRHGETAGNAAGIIQMPEIPLNERGQAQAHACAKRLSEFGIACIVASDYSRAHMTAVAIEQATGAPLEFYAGLRERHFGDYRGQHYSIVPDMFGSDTAPLGGETWDEFHARVIQCWDAISLIAKQTTGNLALVTHGLVCYSLALNCLTLPPGVVAERGFGNTAVTVVDSSPPWRVTTLNCCQHLDSTLVARHRKSV